MNNIKIINLDEFYDTYQDLENKGVGYKISNKYQNVTLYSYKEKFLLEVIDENKNRKRFEVLENSFKQAKLEASKFYFLYFLNDVEYELIKEISLKDYMKLTDEERTKTERYLRIINIDDSKKLILMNCEYYYYIDESLKAKIDVFNFEYFVESELI